jgi:p-hydroxybenzoate 3-monooxygenase
MRTDVAIVGAGPAGLLLAHLLAQDGIESVVVESRSQEYVAARVRAGILESSSVDLLRAVGLGAGIDAGGDEHRGIYLQWPSERHHLDFVELVGRSVWVYGQTQLQADLVAAGEGAGRRAFYEASGAAVGDLETDRPYVTFTDSSGAPRRIDAAVIAGCDGSFGPSRAAVPAGRRETWERVYPYSWLGILADVAPSTDELIYAWHPDGFAMHSMRSATVSRLYLQVPNGTDVADWSDDRIWAALATRLGHGTVQGGWQLTPGPVTDKSVLPMRSFVQSPMRHGRLFLAGDAAHTVPPTGAKGLNLAIADVALLAPALYRLLRRNDAALADAYSDTALRRVWRCEHFSWWMTSMLHTSGDPFDAQLQLSQLRWVTSSQAGAAGLAENYAGLPIGFLRSFRTGAWYHAPVRNDANEQSTRWRAASVPAPATGWLRAVAGPPAGRSP